MSQRTSKEKAPDDEKDDKKKNRVSLTKVKEVVESAKKHVKRLSNVSKGSKSSSHRSSVLKVLEEGAELIASTVFINGLTDFIFSFLSPQRSLPDESADCAGPSSQDDDKDGDKDAKKKKNRCVTCRKKVGLTGKSIDIAGCNSAFIELGMFIVLGFECRCGGLFCANHRYSDKHECSFDYREHGAAEIRRNNPVVVGEKIQKIWSVCVDILHIESNTARIRWWNSNSKI